MTTRRGSPLAAWPVRVKMIPTMIKTAVVYMNSLSFLFFFFKVE